VQLVIMQHQLDSLQVELAVRRAEADVATEGDAENDPAGPASQDDAANQGEGEEEYAHSTESSAED